MADEKTYNDLILEALVRHQIGLLAFSARVRNRIWKLLDATETDLRRQIAERLRRDAGKPLTPARLARVEAVIAALQATREGAWKEINGVWREEAAAIAVAEPLFVSGIIESIVQVELDMAIPTATRMRQIAASTPFEGATLKEWASTIQESDLRRIEQQIKIGMVQGESIPQMSRRIVGTVKLKGADGATAVTRRHADAITRTAVNAITAEARREFTEANQDLIPTELFVATLDSRTTPICRALDGNVYPVGEGPVLPLHWGERSLRVPVVDGEVVGNRPMKQATAQQLVREWGDETGVKVKVPQGQTWAAMRKAVPKGQKGAFEAWGRKRMRELTGTVPAKTSYAEFLKAQSASFQDDLLGPTRGKLFRDGGLELDKFVTPLGRERTLQELARDHAEAFARAGIDPAPLLNRAA